MDIQVTSITMKAALRLGKLMSGDVETDNNVHAYIFWFLRFYICRLYNIE